MNFILLLACLIFFAPSKAEAYLDPGTGNILVYIIISLLGAFVFSLKGIFYKIIGNKGIEPSSVQAQSARSIVLFSEGKSYQNTFYPVITALLERKQPFSYYTMDVDDPVLTIENDLLNNKYIGKGNVAFAKMGKLKADIMLATTPNIGTDGYPLPRSKDIGHLIHVFHAVDDLAYYHKGSLDNYDAVMLVGPFEIPIIRKLEEIRSLPAKVLYPAGLPYLDVYSSRIATKTEESDKKTILVAPSWGEKSCFNVYGWKFLIDLAEKGYDIIVRPHPQSYKVEKELLQKIETGLRNYTNVSWDKNPDGNLSMQKSDLLISDTSAIRLDYLLLYRKPIITLESPIPNPEEFEISDLKESWMENELRHIGYTINKDNLETLGAKIEELINKTDNADLTSFRNNIYNWGKSGEAIADYMIHKLNKPHDTILEEK